MKKRPPDTNSFKITALNRQAFVTEQAKISRGRKMWNVINLMRPSDYFSTQLNFNFYGEFSKSLMTRQ